MPSYPRELNGKQVLILEDFEGSCQIPTGTRKIDQAFNDAIEARVEEIGRAIIPRLHTEIINENGQTYLVYKCTLLLDVHEFWRDRV